MDAPQSGLPGAFTTSVYGGMSIAWTNNCPRAVNGVDRPELDDDAEWEKYYRTAEQHLGVSTDQYDDSRRQSSVAQRLGSPLAEQRREIVRLPLSGRRLDTHHMDFVGPADVLEPVSDRIELLSGSVDAIEFDGSRAVAFHVNGSAHHADDFVVAQGAVETPMALWRAGLGGEALGRHVSYHAVLIAQIVLDDELFDPGPDPDPLPRLCIPPTHDRPWFTMLLRDTNPLPVASTDQNVPANRLIEIQAFAPVDNHPDNRMSLTESGEIEFDVPIRDADEERLSAIKADADELTSQLGRYREGCEPQWAPLGTPHLMGTCRTGTDQSTSVANDHGLVWGTTNLYLATNGLIPTRLAVNPTLTATALALRTADHIAHGSSHSRT
jgi:hypothetical protein